MNNVDSRVYFGIDTFSKQQCNKLFLDMITKTDKIVPLNSCENKNLVNLYDKIINTKWLESKERDQYFNEMLDIVINYVYSICDGNPDSHYAQWFERIQQFCFQGGIGHRITCTPPNIGKYSRSMRGYDFNPHHWCVRAEHYTKIRDVPRSVMLAALITDKHIYIAPTASQEAWGN